MAQRRSSSRVSTRRQFLHGRSAADELADLAAGEQPAPQSVAPTAGRLMRLSRRAMACQFEVVFDVSRHAEAPRAAVEALDLVDELEQQLSVFRDSSETTRVNRMAHAGPVEVEPSLFALLQLSAELHVKTERAFDVTSGPLSKVWGFHRRQGAIAGDDEIRAALAKVGGDAMRLDEEASTVAFDKPGMEINFGAIGKGFAVDCAAEMMKLRAVDDFLVHGGQSSVIARGDERAAGEGWTTGVGHPLRPGVRLAEIRLHDAALGTSGSATQFFRHQGRRYGHVLDPRSGWPAEGTLSSTVVAPSAAVADALATAFYVLGAQRAFELLPQWPDAALLMVVPGKKSGQVDVLSAGFAPEQLCLLRT
jgi:thiamine biosynthesis lipoprotein